MEQTYIFGHRNPDTDSVMGAISLSYLKNRLGFNTVPAVLSSINLESRYALQYFGVKEPMFLNDVKIKVKDLNYTKNYSVTEKDSIRDAYYKMIEAKISKIPVVDNVIEMFDNKLSNISIISDDSYSKLVILLFFIFIFLVLFYIIFFMVLSFA